MLASGGPIRAPREALQEDSLHLSLKSAEDTVTSTPSQKSCKRKREDCKGREILGCPFAIQYQSRDPSSQPITLNPLLVISHSSLPLAYLDLSGDTNGTPGTQLFSASNAGLEKVFQEDPSGQSVLIAETQPDKAPLYAIEWVDTGLYALCRLGGWVTVKALEQIQARNTRIKPQRKRCCRRIAPQDNDWWRDLAIDDRTDTSNGSEGKGKRLPQNIGLCLKKPRSINTLPVSSECIIQEPAPRTTKSLTAEGSQELLMQTSEDIFSMLRTQYQETLYFTKGSLAYFAKGPLSRARASIQSKATLSSSLAELAVHLRSGTVSIATMDKKYKHTIPGIINTLPVEVLSDDDTAPLIMRTSKQSRKNKKQKIGKDGLYPGEELNVARWWLGRKSSSLDSGTPDSGDNSKEAYLLELRTRETQMQIVLLLEALALEASISASGIESTASLAVPEDKEDSQMKKKPKKQQDLNVILDLFVDRLCIWQSMGIDDEQPNRTGEGQLRTDSDHNGISIDALRTFCVDVVLPFYGARLPEVTRMLRQKLGGPKTPSPMRPPLTKAASSSQIGHKPGATIQRPGAHKPRRTLERVLTDEKTALRRRAPGLSRWNTDSILPGLKREVSDTSLTSIPLNRVALHKRYSQREVDLDVVNQAAEAKMKKKATVDQELQGAIAALKRPNPRMAVKEYVEAGEKRAATQSRKSKNPVRNLFAQGVQVMATPKGNRRKDVFGGLPSLPQPTCNFAPEPDEIPPSSIPRVPSSVQKYTARLSKISQPRLPRGGTQNSIEQTPTRGPSKHTSNLLNPDSKPKPTDHSFLTPSKPRHPPNISTLHTTSRFPKDVQEKHLDSTQRPPSPLSPANLNIRETPIKPQVRVKEVHDLAKESIIITSSPPLLAGEEGSIYDALGWNDYDELS